MCQKVYPFPVVYSMNAIPHISQFNHLHFSPDLPAVVVWVAPARGVGVPAHDLCDGAGDAIEDGVQPDLPVAVGTHGRARNGLELEKSGDFQMKVECVNLIVWSHCTNAIFLSKVK